MSTAVEEQCDSFLATDDPPVAGARRVGDAAIEPSVRGAAYGQVNQLRDPAPDVEGEGMRLPYAVADKSGNVIARMEFH